jgi:hypothetical protein
MRTRSRGIESSAWLHLLAAGANCQKATTSAPTAMTAIEVFFLVLDFFFDANVLAAGVGYLHCYPYFSLHCLKDK